MQPVARTQRPSGCFGLLVFRLFGNATLAFASLKQKSRKVYQYYGECICSVAATEPFFSVADCAHVFSNQFKHGAEAAFIPEHPGHERIIAVVRPREGPPTKPPRTNRDPIDAPHPRRSGLPAANNPPTQPPRRCSAPGFMPFRVGASYSQTASQWGYCPMLFTSPARNGLAAM